MVPSLQKATRDYLPSRGTNLTEYDSLVRLIKKLEICNHTRAFTSHLFICISIHLFFSARNLKSRCIAWKGVGASIKTIICTCKLSCTNKNVTQTFTAEIENIGSGEETVTIFKMYP